MPIKRGMHRRRAKRHRHEGVGGRYQQDDLDHARDVVVDEPAADALVRVHGGVFCPVNFAHEEGFENVEADGEDDDETDYEDEAAVGSEAGDFRVDDLVEMGARMAMVVVIMPMGSCLVGGVYYSSIHFFFCGDKLWEF